MSKIERLAEKIGVPKESAAKLVLYVFSLLLIALGAGWIYLPAAPLSVGGLILADLTFGSYLKLRQNHGRPPIRRAFQRAGRDVNSE